MGRGGPTAGAVPLIFITLFAEVGLLLLLPLLLLLLPPVVMGGLLLPPPPEGVAEPDRCPESLISTGMLLCCMPFYRIALSVSFRKPKPVTADRQT